jgi:arsenite/tail-anchored protein-transporting ATPase
MIEDYVLPRDEKTRFIFFSGKGGVGKSTMSCATAVWLAGKGYKTLLVTTDPAPNLSDIFNQPIGHQVTPIKGIHNLSCIEIDPDIASEEYRERAIAPARDILDDRQLEIIKEQMKSPCVEEVAAFDKFIEFMDDPQYDVVIFDTAPTGHTIRLLELPGSWTAEIEKGGSTCIGPSASLQASKHKYEKAISYLQDEHKTSFVFVLRAEKLSILETGRSARELAALGIRISFLIINGLLPAEACTDDFFRNKLAEQESRLKTIEQEFKEIDRVYFPLAGAELNGIELFRSVGDYLYESVRGEMEAATRCAEPPANFQFPENRRQIYELLTPHEGEKTRFIFITGKGGVGKSTLATTTAVYLADRGFRTLVLTTDPAAHLQAIFGQPVTHEPAPVMDVPNLFTARIDQAKALAEYRARIMASIQDMDEDVKTSIVEDLNSPCAEEMAAFEKFMDYFAPGVYDIVVFDTAPTGHTLRLLELPTDWHGYIDLGSLTKNTSDATRQHYDDVIESMRNPHKSTFTFVVYAEYTPIIEAWRASEDLRKQVGINTGLVAVNYLIPPEYGRNRFFDSRRAQQQRYLPLLAQKFGTPLLGVKLFDHEPGGIEDLRAIGIKIFD